MSRLLDFPQVIVPVKCFARGCENPAEDHGQQMFCWVHHLEFMDRTDRAREQVNRNVLAIERRLRWRRWRPWVGLLVWLVVFVVCAWGLKP